MNNNNNNNNNGQNITVENNDSAQTNNLNNIVVNSETNNVVNNETINNLEKSTVNTNENVIVSTDNTTNENNANVVDPMEIAPNESVVNTEKKKEPSNAIIFIFVFVIFAFIFFIDDIVNIFTEDNYIYFNGGNETNLSSDNLVGGYIEVGSKNSYMKLEDIRFYNFKQGNEGEILLNYLSSKSIKNTSNLSINILLYDGAKTLIYKEVFDVKDLSKDTVKQYVLKVDNNVYFDVRFAKVVIFNEKEMKEESSIICNYNKTDGDVTVDYSISYNFINNDLKSYIVTKKIDAKVNEGDIYTKYNNELISEKDNAIKNNISVSDDVNYLNYSVDLNSVSSNYMPYYKINTLPYTINYKETLKGWICK